MKNKYTIRGAHVYIRLRRVGGSELQLRCSRRRLPAAVSFPGTWCVLEVKRRGVTMQYAVGKIYEGYGVNPETETAS
jgi:hypothetical protein